MLPEILAARQPVRVAHDAPVSEVIYSRLDHEDWTTLLASLEGDFATLWFANDDQVHQRRLALRMVAHFRMERALERTGLVADMPPPDIHAMAAGPLAAGGDPDLADAVVGAMHATGFELPPDATILDFGCSSGRVIRMIAAARPDLRCLGCDPNQPAIAWAREHLPAVEFFVSPLRPPLDLESGTVDAAYAISIWSHFAEMSAVAWLDEMWRVLRPGGRLVISTHGLASLSHLVRNDLISEGSATNAATAVLCGKHHFIDVFGEEGDWGIVDAQWGNAYFALDWLSEVVTPRWTVRLFRPGGLDGNQDLIVLGRESVD